MTTSLRARLRAGESAAYGELFDSYADAIFRHAVRVLGDRTTADDVVSVTFLEAWRLRERLLPEGGSLQPWLFGIATNVLRNTARAGRRYEQAMSRLPAPEVEPDVAEAVVDRLAEAGGLTAARRALDELRPQEREVFVLCVWAELDYASAADALDIPVGTVRSRLARARARLRERLQRSREPDRQREPERACGQLTGDRAIAVRSIQGEAR
jgi:RNA polymerase sigma-70 factor (ECF subfamily)